MNSTWCGILGQNSSWLFALRYCKLNEESLRYDSLARDFLSKPGEFWKRVNSRRDKVFRHLSLVKVGGGVKISPSWSRLLWYLGKNSNGYPHVFRVLEFNEAIPNIVWCKRKSEIQDGGPQTEIRISQPVHNVSLRFQKLYLCFQGSGIQWGYFAFCMMHAEVRNPRWRLTEIGNTHFSPGIQHICTILAAKHTYIKAQKISEAILI